MRKGNALIRFYLHLDPDKLSNDEWAIAVNDAQFIQLENAKSLFNELAPLFLRASIS